MKKINKYEDVNFQINVIRALMEKGEFAKANAAFNDGLKMLLTIICNREDNDLNDLIEFAKKSDLLTGDEVILLDSFDINMSLDYKVDLLSKIALERCCANQTGTEEVLKVNVPDNDIPAELNNHFNSDYISSKRDELQAYIDNCSKDGQSPVKTVENGSGDEIERQEKANIDNKRKNFRKEIFLYDLKQEILVKPITKYWKESSILEGVFRYIGGILIFVVAVDLICSVLVLSLDKGLPSVISLELLKTMWHNVSTIFIDILRLLGVLFRFDVGDIVARKVFITKYLLIMDLICYIIVSIESAIERTNAALFRRNENNIFKLYPAIPKFVLVLLSFTGGGFGEMLAIEAHEDCKLRNTKWQVIVKIMTIASVIVWFVY